MRTRSYFSDRIEVTRFRSDDLHSYYDFSTNQTGNVVVSSEFIKKLYNKKLDNTTELPIALELLQFANETEAGVGDWNFYLEVVEGNIQIEIGGLMRTIKEEMNSYRSYLERLSISGIESKIEFLID